MWGVGACLDSIALVSLKISPGAGRRLNLRTEKKMKCFDFYVLGVGVALSMYILLCLLGV